MTQKKALKRILEYAQRDIEGEGNTMMAARALFVVLWLEDINWHSEAHALCEKTLATPRLKSAFEKFEHDAIRTGEFQNAVAQFNWIFGYGLKTEEWRATTGAPLVEELWGIINTLS